MLIKVAAGVWWYEGEDEVEEGALEQTADNNDLQVICAQTATNHRSFGSGVIFAYFHALRSLDENYAFIENVQLISLGII